jgi:hypothetical protein
MTFVRRITGAATIGVAMLIGSGLSAPPAWAGYIVDLTQVGSNVVATGSGTIDLTGLTSFSGASGSSFIEPNTGEILTGAGNLTQYKGITGPTSFGSGGSTAAATSGNGDPVGLFAGNTGTVGEILFLPTGYSGTTSLSDTATYDNTTLATLGATPGTYEWTWGTGPNQNFTLQIGAVPAPLIGHGLPALLAIGGLLFGAKLLEWSKRRRLQIG